MPVVDKALLRAHHAYVASDSSFQSELRLRQSLWRERQGLPIGLHRGNPLGSRLALPDAADSLTNYLTETIREVVRREVLGVESSRGKLYGRPRIFNDLLSSQPMCFNLFGECAADLDLATRAFQRLLPEVARVEIIRFEHSPGRRDPRFTDDNSAHDVFVEYIDHDGARGFVGIEVKYHEHLGDPAASHRPRYDQLADAMGYFSSDSRAKLRLAPLQQIWRDHLLAGSIVNAEIGFATGHFAFVHPADNARCTTAIAGYLGCLDDRSSFHPWTLERVVTAIEQADAGAWIAAFRDRYLGLPLTI